MPCPHCGYCEHCGRSNRPYYHYPWSYGQLTPTTSGGLTQGSTGSVAGGKWIEAINEAFNKQKDADEAHSGCCGKVESK